MISLVDVRKGYRTRGGWTPVLRGLDLQISPGQKVGIVGRNGAGKSTLIRLISGVEEPDSGTVSREMTVSWPLAFGGAFQSGITGMDNIRFICRIYGIDPKEKIEFVEGFAELGDYINEPIKNYSSGMRARLAFAISMAVEFDCFLIDEVVSVGDQRFREKCEMELFEKRSDRAMIIVSHDLNYVKCHCESVYIMLDGKLVSPDTADVFEIIY